MSIINIVVPVYKAKNFLPSLFDSIVAQTFKDFTVILSQDCDGEDYSDIIDLYKKRGLKIILNECITNGGPGVARQAGVFAMPPCKYVVFCDTDDQLFPNCLESLYKKAESTNADIITSIVVLEQEEENIMIDPISAITVCHGKIYRCDYLFKNKIYFLPKLKTNEDSYFNLVAWNSTEKRYVLDEPTYFWKNNKKSITRKFGLEDFYRRGALDYELGQIYGMDKIYELGKLNNKLIGKIIVHLYENLMRAHALGADTTELEKHIKTLKDKPYMVNFFKEGKNWETMLAEAESFELVDGNLIFYKDNFGIFVKNFFGGI